LSKVSRILVFAHDASLYGAAQSLLTLLTEIKKDNFSEILVILPHRGKMEEALSAEGINYKLIAVPRCFTWDHSKHVFQKLKHIITYERAVWEKLPQLNAIIKDFKPNLIYSNTSIISIGAVLAKRNGLPHVWHIREFGDLDYNFEYLPTRNRVIKQMRASQHVIFVSKSLREHWYGNATGNSSVVYNGLVKENKLYPEKVYPSNEFRFGVLGAIVPGKGQEVAIRAMAILAKIYPSVVLYLYGNLVDKEYYKKLQQLIVDLKCSANIVFKGFEDDQDLIYSNLDVLLNCSVMEGFGRTIIEAMQRGIPVVANAAGGPLEIIVHKENGLLYQQSAENLALCIENLMKDKMLYKTISENGKVNALNYTVDAYARRISGIFNNILKK
jgi:glycosyltransferase involved in cell wall biosynthesis